MLSLDVAEVMMVGDGLNDLDALEVVGHSVAMGNAHRIFLIPAIMWLLPWGRMVWLRPLSFLGVFEINRQNLPSGAQLACSTQPHIPLEEFV
ncbi:MAG: hypothetical protein CM15mP49_11700 [Actinomycetota bacterium]|nr:MAG: hypothetical protein CM15mP49_11700 [Actinomycetota bacterium]